tara:strand:- start:144 stop:533 length:390 start_codon:yes stop_codon:yes gene_type:complete
LADYREISQQYAKAAINSAFLVNGGAATALLTQISGLMNAGYGRVVILPMIFWTVGVFVASFIWLVAFSSTRFVDKSMDSEDDNKPWENIRYSNNYMLLGVFLVVLSLTLFLVGAITLGMSIYCSSSIE